MRRDLNQFEGSGKQKGGLGQTQTVFFNRGRYIFTIKVAIVISIAIVFKKVNAKARAKANKTILGGRLDPLGQALKTMAMEMAMASLIGTVLTEK